MVSDCSLIFSAPSRPDRLLLSLATILGPLDRHADPLPQKKVTKTDIEAHFSTHGTGEITEIKLMNGFGFIEYKDAMDARDVVPGKLYCLDCCLPMRTTTQILSLARYQALTTSPCLLLCLFDN